MQIQNVWKPPVQAQKAESAERANRSQGPEGQNQRVQSHLSASSPAALKAMTEKFRVDAKAFAVSLTGSGYTKARTSEGSDSFGAGDCKLASKESVTPRLVRPRKDADSLGRVSKLAPNLGWAAADSEASGRIGDAAGVKGMHKGGGVVGAFVARQMGMYAGSQSGSKDVGGPGKMPSDLKSSWMNTAQSRPSLLAKPQKTELKGGFFEVPASDTGRQRLGDLLQKGAGAVGDFLKNSPVGGLLKSIEGMQGALGHSEAERIKAERLVIWR